MPMSAASMASKIKAAYQARTGKALKDGDFNVLEDLCKGIVEEITQNAKVQPGITVSTTGSAAAQTGATTGMGSIL